jgi:hypothetical protein
MSSTLSASPSAKPPKRDDFAQVMDELDFVKELIARLPTRQDQAFVPLTIMFGSAVLSAAIVILWLEAFWWHSL